MTYLTPTRFAAKPQVGLPIVQEWHGLLCWLTTPSIADKKQAHGAWCPTALEGGAVKGGRGAVSLLVADVDDCGPAGIDHSARVLATYAGAVIPTFNAKAEKPKHRIILLPDRALTPEEFPLAWAKMASSLEDAGVRVDRGCKNINRLYFACVTPRAGAWIGAHILPGEPLPVDAMLEAARCDVRRERAAHRNGPGPDAIGPQRRDRYVAAAFEKARGAVLAAPDGGRHDALLRQAFSLARLELTESQIADALLDAFVAVAGEPRRREGERAICDAVRARRRGAA
ncbi:MAG: hypothetical protein ABSC94_30240 [Polyangiaceae bacterium]